MDIGYEPNEEQATLWNGAGGRGWVAAQEMLDRILKALEELLVAALPALALIFRVR